mmetsp:Transcript_15625/g.47746  ORF Transcript_15625/g.47746 Transcript_15625/m.47746 type:complete len:291 (+) Transcript_15625:1410-2282(+)
MERGRARRCRRHSHVPLPPSRVRWSSGLRPFCLASALVVPLPARRAPLVVPPPTLLPLAAVVTPSLAAVPPPLRQELETLGHGAHPCKAGRHIRVGTHIRGPVLEARRARGVEPGLELAVAEALAVEVLVVEHVPQAPKPVVVGVGARGEAAMQHSDHLAASVEQRRAGGRRLRGPGLVGLHVPVRRLPRAQRAPDVLLVAPPAEHARLQLVLVHGRLHQVAFWVVEHDTASRDFRTGVPPVVPHAVLLGDGLVDLQESKVRVVAVGTHVRAVDRVQPARLERAPPVRRP